MRLQALTGARDWPRKFTHTHRCLLSYTYEAMNTVFIQLGMLETVSILRNSAKHLCTLPAYMQPYSLLEGHAAAVQHKDARIFEQQILHLAPNALRPLDRRADLGQWRRAARLFEQ